MNITEMHIAVQQGVDKIHSLQADQLLSEELDIELNKSITRFIAQKYNKGNKYQKGFEESQSRIDDLRTLVVEYTAPTSYKEEVIPGRIFVDSFKLPKDYLHLVNQRSEVHIQNCEPVEYDIFTDNKEVSYFVLSFNDFLVYNGQYIRSLTMVQNSNVGLTATNGAHLISFVNYPADNASLQVELEVLGGNVGPGFDFYWEEYNGLYHPGSFICVIDTWIHSYFNADAGKGILTEMVGKNDSNEIVTRADAKYQELESLEKRRIPEGEDFEMVVSANKFVQQDDIFALLNDPFNTTKHTSPLATFREDVIDIYTNDIFIIDAVKITYLRKPAKVSLSLQVNCDLPEHTHQEIVAMTVSSMLEGIADPRYTTQQLEVSKSE